VNGRAVLRRLVALTAGASVALSTPVQAQSVDAVADTGFALAGTASKPIVNVAANDTVHGAPATLGKAGNATVAQVGTWPTGITLTSSTGAVSTTASLSVGSYEVQYRLCDRTRPPDCATATDTITVIPAYAEVQASSVDMVDIEFDWGRDGLYCGTCNFGKGNARFNWVDGTGHLWVGHLDPTTGAFNPPSGKNELVDKSAFNDSYFGNGPEWAFSTQDGQIISQLVYTRAPAGMPIATANAGAAFATPVSGGWTTTFFPGALPVTDGGTMTTFDPSASQCNTDAIALAYFYGQTTPQSLYWEPVTTAAGTAPTLLPFGPDNFHNSDGKPSIRWVPCTHQMVFSGAAPPDESGNVYDQVFWFDVDTQVMQQLTTDANQHAEAFMFQAPEFADTYVLLTISNDLEIDVYEQTGAAGDGAPTFTLANRITSPDPAEPYIAGTEPFINCAPTCQTYIFMRLQSPASYQKVQANIPAPNGAAVANIDPAQPVFKILAPEWATPDVQRQDLEYYITAAGPYVYYDRAIVVPGSTGSQHGLRYYIDMQLGAPSGPCVGSSAEGGMLAGC
jgi:hypothetical protein